MPDQHSLFDAIPEEWDKAAGLPASAPAREKPKLGAIAPWFGAKRTLASTIVPLLGDHDQYFELCCGSMAVLLAKEPANFETAVDLHGDLTNLALVLRSPALAEQLFARLQTVMVSEDIFQASAGRLEETPPPSPNLERAIDWFIYSWLGRNGMIGTTKAGKGFSIRWTPNGGSQTTRFRSAIASIPAWVSRLQNVAILRRNIFDVLPGIPDRSGTSIYCDPPYLVKNVKYEHDFGDDDHRRLAHELARFRRTRVVVSYYDDPRLVGLYPAPWRITRIEVAKHLLRTLKNGHPEPDPEKGRAVEVLISNEGTI